MLNRLIPIAVIAVAGLSGSCASPPAEPPPAPGTLAYDRGVFVELLEEHGKIRRTWREVEGGIEATTESDDPRVAGLLQDHVLAMKARLEGGRRLRQWDPLYVAVFDHAARISLTVEKTAKGVRVTETSPDPAVAGVIRAHAAVVSGFAEHGFEESAKEHPAPGGA